MAPSPCSAGAPAASCSGPAGCGQPITAATRAWKAAGSNGLLNQDGAGVPGGAAAGNSPAAAAAASAASLLLPLLRGWLLAESTSSQTRAWPVE